jgi:alkanesulfonate monooxygenase SsuD/methylene tetrahydromethanopterin reductase-like flavin-dependent oxidoreductase (luciferase family)
VHYHALGVRNDPAPIQRRLPILIGGSGERKTLRTVARFADAWNVAMLTPEEAVQKEAVLLRWCEEVGRDPGEIERTVSLGPLVIRDTEAEAKAAVAGFHESNPGLQRAVLTGSPDEVTEQVRRFVELGFRHVIYHLPTPYDDETLQRFAEEVTPNLGP